MFTELKVAVKKAKPNVTKIIITYPTFCPWVDASFDSAFSCLGSVYFQFAKKEKLIVKNIIRYELES